MNYLVVVISALVVPALCQLDCKGTLAGRFKRNKEINDADGDGFVTGAEIYNDFHNNYDINQDDCASRAEWVYRWVKYYRFTPAFASYFVDNGAGAKDPNEKCLTDINKFKGNDKIKLPINNLVNGNINKLVQFCATKPNLKNNNCDCKQLDLFCKNNDEYKDFDACKEYKKSN